MDYAIHDCVLYREQLKNMGRLVRIFSALLVPDSAIKKIQSKAAAIGVQWFIFVAIGVLVGLAAFLIKWGIQILTTFRFSATADGTPRILQNN